MQLPESVTVTRAVFAFAVAVPLLLSLHHAQDTEGTFVQTGSAQDPLKVGTPVNVYADGSALGLALNEISINKFIEMYCYEPMGTSGEQLLITNINITNTNDTPHPLTFDRFLVVDAANTTYPADNDTRLYQGHHGLLDRPFPTNGHIEPNTQRTGDLVFALPENVTPAKLVYNGTVERITLNIP